MFHRGQHQPLEHRTTTTAANDSPGHRANGNHNTQRDLTDGPDGNRTVMQRCGSRFLASDQIWINQVQWWCTGDIQYQNSVGGDESRSTTDGRNNS